MIYAYFLSKKWDIAFTVNGFLAGLVAITCPCYWGQPDWIHHFWVASPAVALSASGVELLEWLRIDDPIGAVPVHGLSAESGVRCRSASLPAANMGQARPGWSLTTLRLSPACSTAAE